MMILRGKKLQEALLLVVEGRLSDFQIAERLQSALAAHRIGASFNQDSPYRTFGKLRYQGTAFNALSHK